MGLPATLLAQSSLTLYGVADAGVGKVKGEKTGMTSSGLMNNDDSVIGLEGREDLGAGLQAGFAFEAALSLADGSTDDDFWESQAHLWLGGDWGQLTLGRTDNPSGAGVDAWELTGGANYSVVANTYAYVGGVDGDDTSSSLFKYSTPSAGGWSAELGYIFEDDHDGNEKWDMNLVYDDEGPVRAGLSLNKTRHEKAGYALGGQYDFGPLAVAASYNDNRGLRRGVSLGASTEVGLFSMTLDLTRDTRNTLGRKYTNGLLEGQYALSKRSFLYAAWLRLDGDNNYGLGLQHQF